MAALLLLLFLVQCVYVIGRTPLSEAEYRYALCGREMWEKPNPALGYFTSCGNMQGDGTLAYRVAGFPLTVNILLLRAEHAVFHHSDVHPVAGSTDDPRHQIIGIPYLLRVPFALFAVWIGGGVWWVSRRLFGNLGGFLALGLFCFSPRILEYATTPNNEVLALWGLYGLVYTAIGIAHAMYGPQKKWKPRIYLFTFALGMTAAAHLLAAIVGLLASVVFMLYIAERRRSYVLPILMGSVVGALILLFANFAFRLQELQYVFIAGSARLLLSLEPAKRLLLDRAQFPTLVAMIVSLVLYVAVRRSRYFGNTAPLMVGVCLLPLVTTQLHSAPWLWAIPFLLTFVAGVFADAFETRYRKLYLALALLILVAQAVQCWMVLPSLHA